MVAKDLGVMFDPDLNFEIHIRFVRACFYQLRPIEKVRSILNFRDTNYFPRFYFFFPIEIDYCCHSPETEDIGDCSLLNHFLKCSFIKRHSFSVSFTVFDLFYLFYLTIYVTLILSCILFCYRVFPHCGTNKQLSYHYLTTSLYMFLFKLSFSPNHLYFALHDFVFPMLWSTL